MKKTNKKKPTKKEINQFFDTVEKDIEEIGKKGKKIIEDFKKRIVED